VLKRDEDGGNVSGGAGTIRIAAVGDLRMDVERRGTLRPQYASVAESADVLLLAGGLTASGLVSEAETLADELDGIGIPIIAVLGARDHEIGQESLIRAALTSLGWKLLDASATIVEVEDMRLGVAGMTGFPGGFGIDYQLWSVVREHRQADREQAGTARFAKALAELADRGADFRVALTHFAPAPGTLKGERETIRANLGNEILGSSIDASGADVALHAMARRGTHAGRTFGGIPVYNVSRPVLGAPYVVLTLPAPAFAG
jgi:inosine/xanthosine triphosphate pyrophosphatase family protein